MKLFPEKLKAGDEIRVIAPALSLSIVSKNNTNYAIQTLESLGLTVTFGRNVYEKDIFSSSSIQSRLDDLHNAFQDKNVKGILAVIGGSNSNQLIKYLDYDLIQKNPKIFCGFSDITALQNAIFHKTGLVTYSGPQFSSFGMKKGLDYTLDFFKNTFFKKLTSITLTPSNSWSDDPWFLDQENRVFYDNEGFWIIHPGKASGTIIGGNICTFQLLHGTNYMPSLEDTIVFIEADSITQGHCVEEFDRDLQSLIHQPNFNKVNALVIGRFEKKFGMNLEKLKLIVDSKKELKKMPIIANVDFGHTMPMITFPIGGTCEIYANSSLDLSINLIE